MLQRRSHLRAVFVLFHLSAITIAALPSTRGWTRPEDWQSPEARAELGSWAARLRTDPEQLSRSLYGLAVTWSATHRAMTRPFEPYHACCGTEQGWRLFVAPNRFPLVVHIDVREGSTWRPIYREHSGEHDWIGHVLRSDRMRALIHLYGRPGRGQNLQALVGWLANRAATSFPEASAIRVRHLQGRLPNPVELRSGVRPPQRVVSEIIREVPR